VRLPEKLQAGVRARWQALMSSTPWAQLRALEARLERLRRDVVALRERVEIYEEEDVLYRLSVVEDLPSRLDALAAAVKEFEDADVLWKVERLRLLARHLQAMDDRLDDIESQLSTLEDERLNEDQMADAAQEAVAALAKRLRDALDDVG